MFSSRIFASALLIAAGLALFLPGLGSCPLWDVDEAHNAECAREMYDSGNWVVPTFNFVLRTDKPALLYWVMMSWYGLLGVTEFAARFGSVLSGLGTMLATCELGRRMFDPKTGLLAGIVLGSCVMFMVSSRAATPDALLILGVTVTMLVFWMSYSSGSRWWFLGCGASMALAVLAKGAVGLVLPILIMAGFLLWERRLRLLWDRRLLWGAVLFALLAVPWYVAVGVETKGAFIRGFFLKHHLERFQQPMEGHAGSVLFHPLVFLVTFAPWSAFLGLTIWSATGRRMSEVSADSLSSANTDKPGTSVAAYRVLWCWIGVWFVFFSLAGTKLPNYTLPAFPAFAILTARFLTRWADGQMKLPRIWMILGFSICSLIGVSVAGAMIVASGVVPQILEEGRSFPELLWLAPWGLILAVTAMVAVLLSSRELRWPAVVAVCLGAVMTLGGLAAWGPQRVARHRAPFDLAQAMLHHQAEREVEIACLGFYQPSLVWYTQREVKRLDEPRAAIDHLHSVKQTYLVTPRRLWEQLAGRVKTPTAIVGAAWDFMANEEIVLITNRPLRDSHEPDRSLRGTSLADSNEPLR
ncbi:MAG: glycosyltransferase family 39 protein [Gemmatales bacterium]|nr:glycosyltransferase family 39 protein [Gemmatales bacterium]MDW8385828.1 glycosyltransferase family 39 protein [Gemmatales bacterium]